MSSLRIQTELPESKYITAKRANGSVDSGVIGDFAPAFEITETPREYRVVADVPGVRVADLEVFLIGARLMVWGARNPPTDSEARKFHTYERTYGTFWRSFYLSGDVDLRQARAVVSAGVLCITVQKKLSQPSSRRFLVRGGVSTAELESTSVNDT